ncbi:MULTISPECIES: YitT family protein [unclassified Sporosarcina]|uniref:YitT family protein n=1 Tax=unclassified Sporosarcina TaxID=2647733 RepID=UPI000C16C93A|nr:MULTISPECIES: YitT family protein [unclassified Sporosarcina]PIC71900.1 hypothetical protein CSV77_01445 [Sporosarcina sp. P16b]PID25668.1 hypothetical protein CSV60_03480 [Sporosarcina sp. P7]
MSKQHKKETVGHILRRYLFISIGVVITAVALDLFLIPNSVIDGGIIGIALILNFISGVPFGILILILNLPFLFFGYKHIGKNFFFSSSYSIALLAIVEFPLKTLGPFVTDSLLATVFGGLLLGAGVGTIIRNGGALDGTEILGILLTKKIPYSVGEFVMFFNLFIFGWAGFVLGPEKAMYSIITYYIASKAIDIVIQGLDETKAVFIISDEYHELKEAIRLRLGRSVTMLHGRGGYTDNEKDVIYVVVTRLEISKLKQITTDIDPNAFLTIMNTHETHGATFKSPIH